MKKDLQIHNWYTPLKQRYNRVRIVHCTKYKLDVTAPTEPNRICGAPRDRVDPPITICLACADPASLVRCDRPKEFELLRWPGLHCHLQLKCSREVSTPHSTPPVDSISRQVAYSSPIPPQLFGFLAAVLVAVGVAVMSLSFVQQMNAKSEGSITKELPLVILSSSLLGFGSLFVLLWSGVYV